MGQTWLVQALLPRWPSHPTPALSDVGSMWSCLLSLTALKNCTMKENTTSLQMLCRTTVAEATKPLMHRFQI